MTPEPSTKPAAEPKVAPAPTVQSAPDFKTGDKVKHLNGTQYTIRHITSEGIALEGVANLVHPETLTPL
jgi:hypothetical protein